MPIAERTHEQEAYRFGFNSQERDDNINGTGNINTAEFWSYDTRLGRRWNMDPIFLASESRYVVNGDNPVIYTDPNGDFRKAGAVLYKLFHGGEILKDPDGKGYTVVSSGYSKSNDFGIDQVNSFKDTKEYTLKSPITDYLKQYGTGLMEFADDAAKAAAFVGSSMYTGPLPSIAAGVTTRAALETVGKPLAKKLVGDIAKKAAVNLADDAAKMVGNLIPEGTLANHLFKGSGKLADNPANRTLIQNISKGDPLVVDAFGKGWYRGVDAAGNAIYTYAQNGIIKGAGYTNLSAAELILKYTPK